MNRWAIAASLLWACGGPRGVHDARDATYAAAERAYARGDYAAARRGFTELAQAEPQAEDRDLARDRLAQIAAAEGDVAQARAGWTALVADGTPERRAFARARLARLLGGGLETEAALRALVHAEPDSVAADKAVRQLALQPVDASQSAALIVWLSEVARRHPDQGVADNAWWFKAHVELLRIDDAAAGRASLHTLLRRWPESPLVDDALWALVLLNQCWGDWSQAVAAGEVFLAERSERSYLVGSYHSVRLDDVALRIGGLHYHGRRDLKAAAAAYTRLLRDFETSVLRDDAWWGLAQARLAQGDRAGGQAALQALIAEDPQSRFAARAKALVARPDPQAVPADAARLSVSVAAALGAR
jgi:tetratricopeptide (TPR) repeat protein